MSLFLRLNCELGLKTLNTCAGTQIPLEMCMNAPGACWLRRRCFSRRESPWAVPTTVALQSRACMACSLRWDWRQGGETHHRVGAVCC